MADQNLDIVIRMIAAGDGAKVTSEQITDLSRAAARGNKEAAEALKELQTAQLSANTAQAEGARTAEKSAEAQRSLKEGVAGVTEEVAGSTGTILRTVTVWGALTIGVRAAISAVRDYISDIDRIEDASRVFETAGARVKTMAELQRDLARHNKEFAEDYERIANAVETVAGALERVNAAIILQRQLDKKLSDATLKKDIAKIDASKATPQEKLQQKADVTDLAAARDKAIEEKNEKQKQEALQGAVIAENMRENVAAAKKVDVDAQIPAATKRADDDAERAGAIKSRDATVKKLLEEQRKYTKRIAGGKDGLTDLRGYDSSRNELNKEGIDSPDLIGEHGYVGLSKDKLQKDAGQHLTELDALTEKKSPDVEAADIVSANSAQALKTLLKEQTRLDTAIKESKAAALKYQEQITAAAAQAAQTAPVKAEIAKVEADTLQTQRQAAAAAAQKQAFNKTADFIHGFFGVDIRGGGFGPDNANVPAPAGGGGPAPAPAPKPISAAEKANKLRLDKEAAARPVNPDDEKSRTRWKKEDDETKRKQKENLDRLRMEDTLDGIKRNAPREASPGADDFGALDESTGKLTGSIDGFASESIALHTATVQSLGKTNQELSDLRTYVYNLRIG